MREQFERDLDAFYASVASATEVKEKQKKLDEYYGPKFSNSDLSDKFMAQFGDMMGICYDINGVTYSFATKFEEYLFAKIDKVFYDFQNYKWLGDSMQL